MIDQENGQQSQNPIRRKAYHRMSNTRIGHRSRVYTAPLLAFILPPEETDGMALEDDEEEVEEGEGDYEAESAVDDAPVERLDGYAQEEDGDGEADEYCGYGVEELAEPPVVEGFGSVFDGYIGDVPSGAVFYAGEGAGCVGGEEYKRDDEEEVIRCPAFADESFDIDP